MASIRPLPLVRLNATHAQALRRLGGQVEGMRIAGLLPDTVPLIVRLSPLSLAERNARLAGGLIRLSMEWAGGRLMLDLSDAAAGVWLRAVLGGAGFAALPAGWLEPAIHHSVERVSALIEPLGRGPLHLAGIASVDQDALREGFVPLWFEAAFGEERVTGLLQLDSMSLLLVSSLMPAASIASGPLDSPALPVPLRLCIGRTALELADLRRLRPGGVVIVAEPFSTVPGELILQTSELAGRSWGLRAQLSGAHLTILERVNLMNANTQDEATADNVSESLAQLPIRLSFDLGERMMTLEEVQSLDVGSAISLDRPLQDFVTIRVNGVAVGEGQLVEMDGRLGVMVSRLAIGGLG